MNLSRRTFTVSGLSIVALAVVVAACSDRGGPLLPRPDDPFGRPPADGLLAALECSGSTGTRVLTCVPASPQGGGSASSELILGNQGEYVHLRSSNILVAQDTFGFDVTVQNLIRQAVGTTDGTTPDPEGVRVIFHSGPVVTGGGGGTIAVANADDVGTFTGNNQPFFRYPGILVDSAISAPKRWKLEFSHPSGGDVSFAFNLYVVAAVQFPNGWVEIDPPSAVLDVGDSLQLAATVYNRTGRVATDDPVTWTSDDAAIASVDADGLVAAEAEGTTWIRATSASGRTGAAEIVVSSPIMARDTTYEAIGNVTLQIGAGNGLLNAVEGGAGLSIVADTAGTAEGGTVVFSTNGSFEYLSAAGFAGVDSVQYTATNGVHSSTAWLKLVSERRFWYVEAGAEAAGADGTDARPFPSLAGAAAVWAAGDTSLVRRGDGTTIEGGVTLQNGQGLIGEGIGAPFTAELNGETVVLLAAGTTPTIGRTTAGATLTLGEDNALHGLAIGSTDGAAIAGTAFGTLTTGELYVSATGPALDLTNGTVAGSFAQLSSTGSAGRGLSLTNVSGTIAPAGGGISDAAAAAIYVNGGSVVLHFAGPVTQGNNAPLLQVLGGHTGEVSLSDDVTATAGTGLQFDDADGTYNFAGETTLNGGDAGVDIVNGSSGTFLFGPDVTITSPTGTAFAVSGSSPAVTFSGSIAKGNAGALVTITDQASGTITFQTGTLSATAGSGIALDNVDGTVLFEGAVSLAGSGGVAVGSGSSGTVTFLDLSATNTTSTALSVNGGAPTLNAGGEISTNAGPAVVLDGLTGGSVTVSASIAVTGGTGGIAVRNSTGAQVAFTSGTKSIAATGANHAVVVENNTATTTLFSGGGLAITSATGNGFHAANGGTVAVHGAGNTVGSLGGTAVNVQGTTIGTGGVVFVSVSANGAVEGIILNGTGGTHGLLVTGDGATPGSGGTITNTAGYGISLTSTGNNDLRYMNVLGANGGIIGSTFGPLAVNNVSVATTGAPALNLTTGSVNGTFSSVSASGSSGHGVSLNAVGGTWTVAGGTVTGSGNGAALHVQGNQGGGTLNWQAALAQTNAHPTLSVATHSSGTLNITGSVSSTGTSTGLRFSDADAIYNISPSAATTLSGSGGAVSILSGSAGTFTFSGNLNAAYTSGSVAPFAVNSSSPNATFNGNLTVGGTATGRLVDVTNQSGGTITFQTGTLSATVGTGILLNNADGTVNFNGTTTLNGGDAGIDVENTSSGTISFASGASVTNPTGEAIRIVNSSPTFTYTGAFSKTSAGTGILVQSSGGTIAFNGSGVTKTLSTSTATAVNLVSNSGTVTFSGGGLAITTTSGAGFAATGTGPTINGGTVQVTGPNNTIATGSGVGLQVQHTAIGASGLTFRSISANGASSGIHLQNTGSAGGLGVTGDGVTAGTGGTIQNTTGVGISLASTTSPNFTRMIIQNTGSHGVGVGSGGNVTNFSFTNGSISNSGTSEVAGRQESNISFYQNAGTGTERNVTGAVVITGNTLTNALHHGINITQYDGTIGSLTISNNTFTSATSSTGTSGAAASKGSAINVNPIGSSGSVASVSSAAISNNVITGFPGNAGILFVGGNSNTGGPVGAYGTVSDSITISGNRIRGHSAAVKMNTQAVLVAVNGRGTGFFRVLDNGTVAEPVTNMLGHAMVASAFGQAVLNIRFTNNRIVANNQFSSNGISMGVDSAANFATTTVMNAVVTNNTISGTDGSGILTSATRSGTLNARIQNNTVGAAASATYAIQLRGATATTATGTTCIQLSGNSATGSGSGTVFPGIGLRRQSGTVTNGPNVFGLVGLSPSPAGTPAVENYVNGQNTSTSGTFGVGGTALISATTGFTSCTLSF